MNIMRKAGAIIVGVLVMMVGVLWHSPTPVLAVEVQGDVLTSVMSGMLAKITGCRALANMDQAQGVCTLGSDPSMSLEEWVGGNEGGNTYANSASSAMSQSIAFLYNAPPATMYNYIADVMHQIDPASPVYAQGIGFGALNPLLSLWKIARNLVYLVFTIVFIVVGFMIMLRRKINPQTVVSIQSALPKLIITLLLVTFSYAIAGFMIDLMYVVIFFIISIFQNFIAADKDWVVKVSLTDGVFRNLLGMAFGDVTQDTAASVGSIVTNLIGGDFLGIVKFISSVLAGLVIAVAILFQTFRVFFALLSSYAEIILYIIFAPFQLLLNALPGSNTFGSWVRKIAANLSVFPVTILLILIVHVLVGDSHIRSDVGPDNAGAGFAPPMLFTGLDTVSGIVALSMIMVIPEILSMVKQAFGVKDTGLGQQVMQGLGAYKRTLPYKFASMGANIAVGGMTQSVAGRVSDAARNGGFRAAARTAIDPRRWFNQLEGTGAGPDDVSGGTNADNTVAGDTEARNL